MTRAVRNPALLIQTLVEIPHIAQRYICQTAFVTWLLVHFLGGMCLKTFVRLLFWQQFSPCSKELVLNTFSYNIYIFQKSKNAMYSIELTYLKRIYAMLSSSSSAIRSLWCVLHASNPPRSTDLRIAEFIPHCIPSLKLTSHGSLSPRGFRATWQTDGRSKVLVAGTSCSGRRLVSSPDS